MMLVKVYLAEMDEDAGASENTQYKLSGACTWNKDTLLQPTTIYEH